MRPAYPAGAIRTSAGPAPSLDARMDGVVVLAVLDRAPDEHPDHDRDTQDADDEHDNAEGDVHRLQSRRSGCAAVALGQSLLELADVAGEVAFAVGELRGARRELGGELLELVLAE